jgi:hypothetical protein
MKKYVPSQQLKPPLFFEPFHCDACNAVFPSYIELLDHHELEHEQNPYPDTGESGETYDAEMDGGPATC